MNKWSTLDQTLLSRGVCLLCGDAGHDGLDLCRPCLADLPWQGQTCERCALPLPVASEGPRLCGACLSSPPSFAACRAPFAYAPPLDSLLQSLKFDGRLSVARSLGEVLARWLAERARNLPELIIPVPLHPRRLGERGFNQSLELARPVARRLGLALELDKVQRRRDTPPQAELSAEQRRGNLRGAFAVHGGLARHVAVFDDVMTTGSTAHELAACLLAAGAARVDVWVCARAGRPGVRS